MCWSAWSTRPRASPASIRSSCGGAISSATSRCRTRPRSAPPTTAAISRRCSTRRWRSPTTTASSSAGAKRRSAASYRGIGISCMLEHAGGAPTESALLTFPGDGTLVLGLNVQNDRPRPCHGVSARWSPSGSASRRDKIVHRHGDSALEICRLRVGRLALGDDGGRSLRQRRSTRCWRRASPSRAAMLEAGEGRHRLSRRPLRGGRHRPARRRCSRSPRAPPR